MRTTYFLILTILMGSNFGCQGIAQVKNQTNQQTNQNNVVVKSDPLKLRLNNEEAGTTDDTSVLTKKLEKVFKLREDEGIFREGTNEIEKTVHLAADRSVSAVAIAKLFGIINGSGVFPIVIPVKIENANPGPNPLTLFIYAGAEKNRPFNSGIEFGFMGELFENRLSIPSNKGAIAVVVDKTGTYTMAGKQISASALEIEIKNRLKTKEKNKRIIFVQAENYGNMEDIASIAASAGAVKVREDIASIAASAGAVKVYVVTKNIEHKENGMSFSLSPAYFKGNDREQITGYQSVRFSGPDFSFFEITLSDELVDKEQAEAETKSEYKDRKQSFKEDGVSLTEIDGSSGILTIQNDEENYHALWRGFRKKNGKQQLVRIVFACPTKESNYSHFEFLQIMKSIKFN